MITSSRSKVFFKTGALNNFTNFTKKPVLESYFKACKFIEKRRQHKVFSYEICKFFKYTFFTGHFWRLLFTEFKSCIKCKQEVQLQWPPGI